MAKRRNRKKQNEKYQANEHQLTVKRPYKDTIFRMLYHDKENLLSLYNAMNGKNIRTRTNCRLLLWIMLSIWE